MPGLDHIMDQGSKQNAAERNRAPVEIQCCHRLRERPAVKEECWYQEYQCRHVDRKAILS